MKVYSDILEYHHLVAANDQAGVTFDRCVPIRHPRVRKNGWEIRLTGSSTRHRNSGTHGAATWESAPATWDEHGVWMAHLFAIDPRARIADYDGADAFHNYTDHKFQTGVAR